MKTRGVIGKRIVAIRQERIYNESVAGIQVAVKEIILEGGTSLHLVAWETIDEPITTIRVARQKD